MAPVPQEMNRETPAASATQTHYGRLGARPIGDGACEFLVWAPLAEELHLRLLGPPERILALESADRGYFRCTAEDISPRTRYRFRLRAGADSKERPDPASRYQPDGVHGPSAVVDPYGFDWREPMRRGRPLSEYILYELHVGTFTREGTFDAVVPHLDRLCDLGITALEIMPIAQFPGTRNWGYDGAFPFAAQNSYGGPEGLQRLVDECHARNLAVVLDVVYNHLGPEGNYLRDFGPYFTSRYQTPWGEALNYDGAGSDEVRRFFIENALYWIDSLRVDALRLDAIHGIIDTSAQPFLAELAATVHAHSEAAGRRVYLIAESDLNDMRVIRPVAQGGLGMDAQWHDDFHHCVHALVTGERDGYYADFGSVEQMATALRDGFVYSGQYSAARRRRHGNSSREAPAQQFVVCIQNHDQVGNRMRGERLSELVSFEGLKLAAGVLLLSPYIPLLFMGEEYGETAPFQYFVSHSEDALIEAVRAGRKQEFAAFGWQGEAPDPQAERTFETSRLTHHDSEQHLFLSEYYRELLRLRRELPALALLEKAEMQVVSFETQRVLLLRRGHGSNEALIVLNFSDRPETVTLPVAAGVWQCALNSADERWGGPGSSVLSRFEVPRQPTLDIGPLCCLLFTRTSEV